MVAKSKAEWSGGGAGVASLERLLLPHLDAAYNLARWLMADHHHAEDMVQEAYLRAIEYFNGFRGEAVRPWLLTIVRNVCYTRLRRNEPERTAIAFDEAIHTVESESSNPEAVLLRAEDRQALQQALEGLPVEFREVIVLRELEGMSYEELSTVIGIPLGTVMSRLARARKQLRQLLAHYVKRGTPQELVVRDSDGRVSTTGS